MFDDVLERLEQADNGRHQIGNILIAIAGLIEIIERQQERIEALELGTPPPSAEHTRGNNGNTNGI